MNYKDFDNLLSDKKMELIYSLLDRIKDNVMLLMSVAWRRVNNITLAERNIVEKMLNEYDYEIVRDAFEESVAQEPSKRTLAYVRAVAKQLYSKKCSEKNEIEGNKFKADLNKKDFFAKGEDAKNWEGMFKDIKNKMEIEK